jgi:hypothetical protein
MLCSSFLLFFECIFRPFYVFTLMPFEPDWARIPAFRRKLPEFTAKREHAHSEKPGSRKNPSVSSAITTIMACGVEWPPKMVPLWEKNESASPLFREVHLDHFSGKMVTT